MPSPEGTRRSPRLEPFSEQAPGEAQPISCPSLGGLPPLLPSPGHSQATEPRGEMECIWRHEMEATLHDGAGDGSSRVSYPGPWPLPTPAPDPQCGALDPSQPSQLPRLHRAMTSTSPSALPGPWVAEPTLTLCPPGSALHPTSTQPRPSQVSQLPQAPQVSAVQIPELRLVLHVAVGTGDGSQRRPTPPASPTCLSQSHVCTLMHRPVYTQTQARACTHTDTETHLLHRCTHLPAHTLTRAHACIS